MNLLRRVALSPSLPLCVFLMFLIKFNSHGIVENENVFFLETKYLFLLLVHSHTTGRIINNSWMKAAVSKQMAKWGERFFWFSWPKIYNLWREESRIVLCVFLRMQPFCGYLSSRKFLSGTSATNCKIHVALFL